MKTLLLMRHAKSSWKDLGLTDHQRPLNKRGTRDAPRMGQLLAEKELVPAAIFSSTAVRAHSTAEAVAETSGFEGELHLLDSLYHADLEDLIAALQSLADDLDSAMLVGHNPGMEYFLEQLTDVRERMPTGAIAHIDLTIERWADLDEETQGQLRDLWLPRSIH